MRSVPLLLAAVTLAGAVNAQDATIPAPTATVGKSYNPQLSAKEAVLANWELAAAGLRAGQIVAEKVVALGGGDASYAALARQAGFAEQTMIERHAAAQWLYAAGMDIGRADADALRGAVDAAAAPCADGPCAEERAALIDAFAAAAAEMGAIAASARVGLEARTQRTDAALMAEQLDAVATYLESGDWAADLTLTDHGRDGIEVAARIVGTMAIWRNVEPYVGLVDPALDAAINEASTHLLRTMRQQTRGAEVLAADGPEIAALAQAADALAAEFRQAAALFST